MHDESRSTPSFNNTFLSDTIVLTASASATYSVSIELRLTHFWKFVAAVITALQNLTGVAERPLLPL